MESDAGTVQGGGERNPFGSRRTMQTSAGEAGWFDLQALEAEGLCCIAELPYSIRIMLESVLRHAGGGLVTEEDVASVASWKPGQLPEREAPFMPGRVLMQDFTGVPAVVDLAAMRNAMERMGGDAERINPLIPTELVVDHSVQVDAYGSADALASNEQREFERNRERYAFLKWGQQAFDGFTVVPPSMGIVHQVNLEYLSQVVCLSRAAAHGANGGALVFPDTLVGMDSHTTMVNGLGVLGWGVGGIEAEAAMLGQPYYLQLPEVVGVNLQGRLCAGVLATDLVLHVTQMLRELGVVGKFVEFHGEGMASLSLADRATLANMAPEYGATVGFFPVDGVTLEYLRTTARSPEQVALVERYCKQQQLFVDGDSKEPPCSVSLSLDMGTVEACLAGPKRPQDRVPLQDMQAGFRRSLTTPIGQRGFGLDETELNKQVQIQVQGESCTIKQGSVAIAAITSCTNTSNPTVLLTAGLLARKARERGLRVSPSVKTSLAPGSRVVTDYLNQAGFSKDLEALGFYTVGYGCTTCIGNSGPLLPEISQAVQSNQLVAASVLSGNRNFEGRVNPHTQANYLASPPLVVAYALAGTVDIDLTQQPLGQDTQGKSVFLRDIWPAPAEVDALVKQHVTAAGFKRCYASMLDGNQRWNQVPVSADKLYNWDAHSSYIQQPPFFQDFSLEVPPLPQLNNLRVLAVLGDSITTDHISPAGTIMPDSAAGQYLQQLNIQPDDFNSFGARRGNHRVMMRGSFGNIRLKNLLVAPQEGSFTRHFPSGEQLNIYQAARRYAEEGVPLMLIGGKEYGTGSSRDWAAKGSRLLGLRVVLVEGFERIHRSNLLGMGVLPLEFMQHHNAASLGLTGEEIYSFKGDRSIAGGHLEVLAAKPDGTEMRFQVKMRLDTPVEVNYYRNGGILQTVLRQLLSPGA